MFKRILSRACPRTLELLLLTAMALCALAPSSARAVPVVVCLTPLVKAVNTHVHDATVVFEDRCLISTKTEVTRSQDGVTQPKIVVSPAHTNGERLVTIPNLKPGTRQCVRVSVTHSSGQLTSSELCASTKTFAGTSLRDRNVLAVGPVSSHPNAALGASFSVPTSRAYQIAAKQDGQCRGIVVRDQSGNFVARGNGCTGATTFLHAGQLYQFYAIDGVSTVKTPATCAIEVDGAPFATVACGWRAVGFNDLKAAERIQAVHLPPEDFLPPRTFEQWNPPGIRMVRLDTKGSTSIRNSHANFVARGAEQVLAADSAHSLILVGFATDEPVSIQVRLVRNDVTLADRDGDGLGDLLEEHLGLCDEPKRIRGGFDCSRAFDQRDTDGDGIGDGWETLGRRKPANLTGRDQPLPYWGANPRHKDLFWEVDYTQKLPSDSQTLKFSPFAARRAHAGFAFKGNAFYEVIDDQLRAQANAQTLENPDGKPGIELHVDNGERPTGTDDWTMFGDWGGYTSTNMNPDTDCKRDAQGNIVSCNHPQDRDIWDTAMDQVRYGIFKWALGVPSNGGKAAWGFAMTIGIAADNDSRRQSDLLVHEGGHTLGLDHSGPFQLDQYVRSNYDPENGGFNCEPFYTSVMNYLYEDAFGDNQPITFADRFGINTVPVNNTRLIERGALNHYMPGILPSVSSYLTQKLREKRYPVSPSGDVDWNRDGIFSTTPVAAGSNRFAGDCDEARANRTSFDDRFFATQSLATATFGGVLQLVGVDKLNRGWWAGVRFDADCTSFDGTCAEVYPKSLPAGIIGDGKSLPIFPNVSGVDVAVLNVTGGTRNVVAVGVKAGTATVSLASAAQAFTEFLPHWSPPNGFTARHATTGATLTLAGEPELVSVPPSTVPNFPAPEIARLFVRASNNQVFVASVGVSGSQWHIGSFRPVFYTAKQSNQFGALVVDNPVSSVSGLHMFHYATPPADTVPGASPKVVHLFVPKGRGVIVLKHVRDAEFVEVDRISTQDIQPNSKPVPVFVTRVAGNANYGQLYLYYTNEKGTVRFARAMSRPDFDEPLSTEYVVEDFGMVDHDGIAGPLVAATAEPGVDEQARVFYASRSLDGTGKPTSFHGVVYMIPRPENIYDKDMWGFDDWQTLKHTICFQVSRGGDHKRSRVIELGGTPINCRPIPTRDPTHPGL